MEAHLMQAWKQAELAGLEALAQRREADGIAWRSWGQGPDLVLLHGSAGAWTHWVRNIAVLSRTHTVHVPDLPGCGDSRSASTPASLAALAAALLAGFDGLRGADVPFALLGFSFGSFVAEAIALLQPMRLRYLVLIRGSFGERLPPMPSGLVPWRHLIGDAPALREAHRHNLATLMFHDAERIDDTALELHARNQSLARLDVAALMGSRSPDALARLSVVPQCMSGEFDVLSGGDLSLQERALRRQQPDAGFHVIPEAGHGAAYEQADAFNAQLSRILCAALAR
jgi:pimeloyl-ACP methyl ester carboxylesterase